VFQKKDEKFDGSRPIDSWRKIININEFWKLKYQQLQNKEQNNRPFFLVHVCDRAS
jgi:tRNA(His) 5'-end guanylyltransferase